MRSTRSARELLLAGVYRFPPVEVPATKPGTRTDLGRRAEGTMLAPNPVDPLYFENATTRPVDFHSFRRAFNTALAEAGVNVQHAMHLASHSDAKVHQRYGMSTAAMRAIPDAALPRLPVGRLAETARGVDSSRRSRGNEAGNVTGSDDSTVLPSVPAGILNAFGAGGGSRTPDLARMNGVEESALSTIARPCSDGGEMGAEYNPACFPLSTDDSSRSVTEKRVERSDPSEPAEAAPGRRSAPEVQPATPSEVPPATSDEAIKLAIKLAVDAGEYERASALLDVAKRTPRHATVTPIGARGRDERRG